MDNSIFEKILPFVSLGMMTLFLVFVIVNALFGLGRGIKRASLRLVITVGLLLVAFFVSPLVVNGTLHVNFKVGERTPNEWVDYATDEFIKVLQQQFGDYVTSFRDEIQIYALGIVLAVLNIVMFYALYFVVKFIGWIIYAITAHFVAPKRDRDGNKLPKYAGWGALVGAVQGIFLFVIFMFPINGLLGVVNHAAEYQAAQNANQPTTQATVTVGGEDHEINTDLNQPNVKEFLNKMNGPLKAYNSFVKYTGLQFFSDKAFEYQLTVRFNDNQTQDVNLAHDINSGVELYFDSKEVMDIMQKLQNAYSDGKLDLTGLDAEDYETLRKFINKAFDLQILNVANDLLGKMDKIFSAQFNDNTNILVAEPQIYENSIYGLMIKNNVDDVAHYAEYAKGLKAAVNYVGEQGLNLVGKDLINAIDFLETLNIYKVQYDGLSESKTLAKILAQGGLGVRDYFDLSTAKLARDYDDYRAGEYLINVLGDRLVHFSTVQLIGQKDIDNLLLYSKQMDGVAKNDTELKELINGLIPLFVGEDALSHDGQKGNWEILGNDILKVAHVARDYVTVVDDINREKERLINEEFVDPNEAQMQAILNYLSQLVTDGEDKYQKIDEIIDAVYHLTDDFEPVKTFIKNKLATIGGGYVDTLVNMIDQEQSEWERTLHNILNVADILNNSDLGKLVTDVKNGESPENLGQDFVQAVQNMDATEVVDMLTGIMDIEEARDIVKDSLGGVLEDFINNDDNRDKLAAALPEGADMDDVMAQIENLNTAINNYGTSSADEDALRTAVTELWKLINPEQSAGD